jgi:hypothetical protein
MLKCHCGETDPKKLTITEDAVECDVCLKLAEKKYNPFARQSTQGTAVAPTLFAKWLDGSTFTIEQKNVIDPENIPQNHNLVEEIRKMQRQQVILPMSWTVDKSPS